VDAHPRELANRFKVLPTPKAVISRRARRAAVPAAFPGGPSHAVGTPVHAATQTKGSHRARRRSRSAWRSRPRPRPRSVARRCGSASGHAGGCDRPRGRRRAHRGAADVRSHRAARRDRRTPRRPGVIPARRRDLPRHRADRSSLGLDDWVALVSERIGRRPRSGRISPRVGGASARVHRSARDRARR